MYTDYAESLAESLSCSECKMESIERRWTQLLLDWLNKCVHPKSPVVNDLNAWSIVEAINKYKQDICADEILDTDILCCDDIESFLRFKYPLLKLRYFYETKEVPRKMYILYSILLYHCCVRSEEGLVDSDICVNLSKKQQEVILKFCEILTDMEVTVNNVETAIENACNSVKDESISLKKNDQDQKLSTIQSDSSKQSGSLCMSTGMTESTIDSIVPDSSTTNTTVTVASSTGTIKRKFYTKPSLSEGPSFITKLEVKSVQENTSCSMLDRSCNNSKALGKPRKKSLKKKIFPLKFKSSVTLLPSAALTDGSYSEIDYVVNFASNTDLNKPVEKTKDHPLAERMRDGPSVEIFPPLGINVGNTGNKEPNVNLNARQCKEKCGCSKCTPTGPSCGDPGNSTSNMNCDMSVNKEPNINKKGHNIKALVYNNKKEEDDDDDDDEDTKYRWISQKSVIVILVVLLIIAAIIPGTVLFFWQTGTNSFKLSAKDKMNTFKFRLSNEAAAARMLQLNSYICKEGICEKVYSPTSELMYPSLSRCILLCMGPLVWPHPIGYTYYSKQIAVVATSKLEYKFQSVPSEAVHMYLAEAFKLFLGELAKLERYTLDTRSTNISRDSMIKKMIIQMDVETDPNPRLNLETDESYTIKVETETNQLMIKLLSASFCGMRHALETLGQLILLDQSTGNLITLTNMIIKDGPSYKYRGLMIDTGRNYIPVPDIMRTIDAMASVKLNTFHWRISDVTSFPLQLTAVPQLFEHGSYGRTLVYTKSDVKKIVRRAGIRGIRVLLEVATPGPVGRAWSWMPEATCPSKDKNFTCNNVLCLRLGTKDTVYDILQILYTEILEMTKVDDIFHLSDSVFSLVNCFYLMEDREGFLGKALERLKMANKGILPKLPIVWYTTHLLKDIEARTWDRLGVQLTEWQPNPSGQFLTRFKVIHSSRWDLSCEITKQRCNKYRTWQDMYAWKSWKTLEVYTIMGGEAILWTDMVDTGNIDYHLWPRTAAVAERLWSDVAINGTVTSPVYVRLDSQRWRMVLKSVQVQPIWPLYCSFSPGVCLQKIKNRKIYFTEFYFYLNN